MNGFDVYKKLSKIDDKAKYCFITAYEMYYQRLKEDYLGLDVKCFIKKPIDIDDW